MRRKVATLRLTSVHRKAHKIHKQQRTRELLEPVLEVKTRTAGEYKVPPPCRHYQMICAINHRKDTKCQQLIEVTQPLPPPAEPELYNGFISKEPDYCFP